MGSSSDEVDVACPAGQEDAVRDQLVPGAELAGVDLSGRWWGAVDLDGAILTGSNLSRAEFSTGYLLTGEMHTKHHLEDALYASSFCGADLCGADLSGANLFGCDFARANLSRACLDGADLRRANLHGAYLEDASLVGARLSGACLDEADAQAADFRGADLRASRIPETESDNYMLSPKYVGVAEIAPASVVELMLSRGALDLAHTDGVDLSTAIGLG